MVSNIIFLTSEKILERNTHLPQCSQSLAVLPLPQKEPQFSPFTVCLESYRSQLQKHFSRESSRLFQAYFPAEFCFGM